MPAYKLGACYKTNLFLKMFVKTASVAGLCPAINVLCHEQSTVIRIMAENDNLVCGFCS